MTKNTRPKKDDPEQSKRFVETAKKVKAEKGGKAFEKAMATIAKDKTIRDVGL